MLIKLLHSFLIWFGLSGFLCAAYALQIPKGYDQELLVLGILYLYITLYILFCHIPTTIITQPYSHFINYISRLYNYLNPLQQTLFYATTVTLLIVATVFSFPEKPESPRIKRLIPLFGIVVFLVGTYSVSMVNKTNHIHVKYVHNT
jgi:CNT family concentrative nucleoside transporter